jgi:hypothetical protein
MVQRIQFHDKPQTVSHEGEARTLDAAALGLDPLPWLSTAPSPEEKRSRQEMTRIHSPQPAAEAGIPQTAPGYDSITAGDLLNAYYLEGR